MNKRHTMLRSEETGDDFSQGGGGGDAGAEEASLWDKLKSTDFSIDTKNSADKEKDAGSGGASEKNMERKADSDPPANNDGNGSGTDDADDDFPDISKGKKTADKEDAEFDETAFDSETTAILKQIEAKGHPGDVYKKLRSELKELKKSKSQVDISTIPEVVELRQKASEAETIKTELEALRQRNLELMSIGDESVAKQLPEYIEKVKTPRMEMESFLDSLAQATKMDKQLFIDIIFEENVGVQDRALDKLESEIGARNTGRIERLIDDYKKTQKAEQEILKNAKSKIEFARAEKAREAAKLAEAKKTAYKAAVTESFTKYAAKIPGFTDSSGALTESAKAAMAGVGIIDIENLDSGDLAFMAFAAKALGPLRKKIAELESKYIGSIKSKERDKSFSSGGDSTKSTEIDPDDERSLVDIIRDAKF